MDKFVLNILRLFSPPLHYSVGQIILLGFVYFAVGGLVAYILRTFSHNHDNNYVSPFYRQALFVTLPLFAFVTTRTFELEELLHVLPSGGLWVWVWLGSMLCGFYTCYNRPRPNLKR